MVLVVVCVFREMHQKMHSHRIHDNTCHCRQHSSASWPPTKAIENQRQKPPKPKSHRKRTFLPALLPFFLPSILPCFLASLLPSFLASFLPSVLASYLPSFLPSLPFFVSFLYFFIWRARDQKIKIKMHQKTNISQGIKKKQK